METVKDVVVSNRTHEKARQLVEQFRDNRVSAQALGQSPEHPFDLIINSTAASLSGDGLNLPSAVVGPQTVVYDMMYGAQPSNFMQWAAAEGARVHDGLGMLVEQAAESFYLWRGVRPETGSVFGLVA